MTRRVLYATQFAVLGIHLLVAVPWASAQSPKAFDVISIKPDRDGHGLDAGAQPGGRYIARNVSAEFLLLEAFGIKEYQIVGRPKWLDAEHYDISAKIESPNQLSREQLRPLLQAMLMDRFSMKFHTEMREFPVYSLVMGKGGPKFEADNIFLFPPSLNISVSNGRGTLTGRRMPMSALADQLGNMAGRTVIDNTGLKGDYDFKLTWAPSESPDDSFPSLFSAVQDQLGLKLIAVKKANVTVVVIERMDRASAN